MGAVLTIACIGMARSSKDSWFDDPIALAGLVVAAVTIVLVPVISAIISAYIIANKVRNRERDNARDETRYSPSRRIG